MTTILADTYRLRDQDGTRIPGGAYIWRGPANVPVFALENCREIVAAHVKLTLERPCEAVAVIERTKVGPGVVVSTMNRFIGWRVEGNGLVDRGFWCRATINQNNEHMEFHANVFSQVGRPFLFAGTQSKHHRLTHNVVESYDVAVSSDAGFHWQGGTIAVGNVAFKLTNSGDPVTITDVGIETTRRLLESSGPTHASQPIALEGVRYEADRLHPDGHMVVLKHPGPLSLHANRFGGGAQPIPRILLDGFRDQAIELHGNTFGSFGADKVCPVRAPRPSYAKVGWGRNVYYRAADADPPVSVRDTWPSTDYA